MVEIRSHLQGTIVAVVAVPGAVVRAGDVLLLIESMKMHHDVVASESGRVEKLLVEFGSSVMPGDRLALLDPGHADVGRPDAAAPGAAAGDGTTAAATAIRPDLAEAVARHDAGQDEARPGAVA
ncbi:MAG: acetyl-CoA carboxylase biotin carboxyl carrier protein subunit, partial [Actinomycetota bacterium]|nr:acetyl-CoA carboxylase biotin carboxyl carrier protein subunit [Actinomycetota bacterium]